MLGIAILLMVISAIGTLILINIVYRQLGGKIVEIQYRLDAADSRISDLLDKLKEGDK